MEAFIQKKIDWITAGCQQGGKSATVHSATPLIPYSVLVVSKEKGGSQTPPVCGNPARMRAAYESRKDVIIYKTP
eukprot:1187199-Prorocentrum_minimum.AAC.4